MSQRNIYKWCLPVLIFIGLFIGARFCIKEPVDLKAPFQVFKVEKGEGALTIAKKLEQDGLINNRWLFSLYVFTAGQYSRLQAGTYSLSSSMDIPSIVEKMMKGESAYIKITIPEGLTSKQIEERIIQKIPLGQDEIALDSQKAKFYKDKFDFLKSVPDNANLEGFFFPDTYYFSIEASREEIVEKMLDNFGKKISPGLREAAREQGKSILDIVTTASMLEKEVRTMRDKNLVAGILWKRLGNNIPLQVDATIVFITGGKTTKVTSEETKIDSPYNTYKYKGLPAGPICNPGLESIEAAVYPQESEFWYYLSTPEGQTIFSKTFEEHSTAKQEYLK